MTKMIFVNLAVSDVAKATAFYEAIGAVRDPRFCNEECSMVKVEENIAFMLMSHRRFSDFTKKPIIDSKTNVEALFCLSETSREAVDATLARAVAAGGKPDVTPEQDFGFMYGRSFEDLDGHAIEVTWMDVAAFEKAMAPQAEAQPQVQA